MRRKKTMVGVLRVGVLVVVAVCGVKNASALTLGSADMGCAPTAEAAVAQLLTHDASAADAKGFRVEAVRLDRVHKHAWAMVKSCSNPAMPAVAIELPRTAAVASEIRKEQPLVHAGERVVVLSQSGDSRMRLTGVAEENGVLEQRIRVRLDASILGSAGQVGAQLRCDVVKDGVVEVVE